MFLIVLLLIDAKRNNCVLDEFYLYAGVIDAIITFIIIYVLSATN